MESGSLAWAVHDGACASGYRHCSRLVLRIAPKYRSSGVRGSRSEMPTIYRAMKQTDQGLPVIGSNSKELGVRIPPNPSPDVDLDESRNVVCNGKGMSVVENWRRLLLISFPSGSDQSFLALQVGNAVACFRFGQGPFAEEQLNSCLAVVFKGRDTRGGNVVPIELVSIGQFQDDLAATYGDWVIDET